MSLQAKELRIGNHIENIKGDQFKVLVEDFETIHEFPENYNPIPLTEEWLGELGFNIKEGEEHYGYGKNYAPAIQFDSEDKKEGFWFFYDDRFADAFTKLKYVHQLQNLYYVLTGQELKEK